MDTGVVSGDYVTRVVFGEVQYLNGEQPGAGDRLLGGLYRCVGRGDTRPKRMSGGGMKKSDYFGTGNAHCYHVVWCAWHVITGTIWCSYDPESVGILMLAYAMFVQLCGLCCGSV